MHAMYPMGPIVLSCPLISVHFPKAGGTSFGAALKAAFGTDNVHSEYDCDPADPGNPCWVDPAWFWEHRPRTIHPFQVVHGHIPIQKYDLISPALRIVSLREPVNNLISIFFFWKSLFDRPVRGHALYEFAKTQRLSLLELATLPKLRRLMSETYFGGFDMRRFDVIGTHERREQFLIAVSNAIGRPLSMMFRENVTPPSEERGNLMTDTKLMAKLRLLLEDDIRFYETHSGQR
jgi:hypothetical protein